MGCYVDPDDTSKIESVVAALKELPRGAKLLVEGEFNVNLVDQEGYRRGEDITAEIATEILEDMPVQFLLRRSSW